jgi:K+-transporting ATPase ATPase B chain
VVLVEAGDMIPADGEVIEGVASVNESAITGESAPVIRESGGDFNAVTGGTTVLSDWLIVRVTVNPGEAFIDRMIAMVEGAKRQKTPNEIALTILLLLRPDEVLSGILDAPVLEVTHDAFRILFQHHHMSTGCVA